MVGGKWGYINTSGQLVINPQFDNAWQFHDTYSPALSRSMPRLALET
jgi:hypothetical protein